MSYITMEDLDKAVDAINRVAGTPLEYIDVSERSTLATNPFHYHISIANGGYALHQNGATGEGLT